MNAYFDNAATTFPKPERVYDFMNEFYRNCGGNAGRGFYGNAKNSAELIFETRKLLLDLFHAPAKQLIFAPGATIALNMIIQGLIKRGMKNIYISPLEHNAVTRTLASFEEKINTRILPLEKSLDYDEKKILALFEKYKPDLIVMSHASNVIGFIQPVEKIFNLAKKFNCVTLLDASQTAGLVDIEAASELYDFIVFAGHKTLYAPTGISGFIMKKSFNLPAILFGGTGTESATQKMPEILPEKLEAGTLNILGIAGLHAATKWILEQGVSAMKKKSDENRARLLEIFSGRDFLRVVENREHRDFVDIVSILFDAKTGISSDSAAAIFAERGIACRGGLHCSPLAHKHLGTFPAGTLRFSGSWFTQESDFEALEITLRNIEREL